MRVMENLHGKSTLFQTQTYLHLILCARVLFPGTPNRDGLLDFGGRGPEVRAHAYPVQKYRARSNCIYGALQISLPKQTSMTNSIRHAERIICIAITTSSTILLQFITQTSAEFVVTDAKLAKVLAKVLPSVKSTMKYVVLLGDAKKYCSAEVMKTLSENVKVGIFNELVEVGAPKIICIAKVSYN